MNKITIIICLSLLTLSALGQKKSSKTKLVKPKVIQQKNKYTIVDSFDVVLYPKFGKEYEDDPSKTTLLKDTCNLNFSFTKINDLDVGACVCSFENNGDLRTQELYLKDNAYYTITCKGVTYSITATLSQYIKNTTTPIAGKAVFHFKIYKQTK